MSNIVNLLTLDGAGDPTGRLMHRLDLALVELAGDNPPGRDETIRARIGGLIEAVTVIWGCKEADVREAMTIRWNRAHS